VKTRAEFVRHDLTDVVIAAGKRLGEALRTIEEYLKTVDAERAVRVEKARYAFYDLEQRIAFTLRPLARGFADIVRLYVLITETSCNIHWLDAARQAIEGGADCLQLREKSLDSGELLRRAKDFVALCKVHNVVSIINDRPDIAMMSDADGVHVGQGDLPARDVRKLIGSNKILGVSTHELSHAKQAVLDGADYIGVGPVFVSGTKRREFVAGLAYAKAVAEAKLPIPAVAIAGITAENVDDVLKTGIKSVAVTASVIGCDDVRGAAQQLKRKLAM
jgi:thiamine-phosphate pyrophosphorylase